MVVSSAAGAVLGGATGSFLGPAGTVAGYLGGSAWGFAAGYLACPYLVPAVRRKIEAGSFMTDFEARSAAEAMGRYAGVNRAVEALRLVSLVKGARVSPRVSVCLNPSFVAKQILAAT